MRSSIPDPQPNARNRKVARRSTSAAVTAKLRAKVLSYEDGHFLGNAEMLVKELDASPPTVRQAARLLEREGVLRVKRGIGGGYYATRPTYKTIEAAVSEHLEALHMPLADAVTVASALWIEAVRQAADIRTGPCFDIYTKYAKKISALGEKSTWNDVLSLELAIRSDVFEIIGRPYIELIFRISSDFGTRYGNEPSHLDGTDGHRAFVQGWREAKLLELNAIANENADIAVLAAQLQRKVWEKRVRASDDR